MQTQDFGENQLAGLLNKCAQELFHNVQENEKLCCKLDALERDHNDMAEKNRYQQEELVKMRRMQADFDAFKRDLPFIIISIHTTLAQARADLAEIRTDLDLCFKAPFFFGQSCEGQVLSPKASLIRQPAASKKSLGPSSLLSLVEKRREDSGAVQIMMIADSPPCGGLQTDPATSQINSQQNLQQNLQQKLQHSSPIESLKVSDDGTMFREPGFKSVEKAVAVNFSPNQISEQPLVAFQGSDSTTNDHPSEKLRRRKIERQAQSRALSSKPRPSTETPKVSSTTEGEEVYRSPKKAQLDMRNLKESASESSMTSTVVRALAMPAGNCEAAVCSAGEVTERIEFGTATRKHRRQDDTVALGQAADNRQQTLVGTQAGNLPVVGKDVSGASVGGDEGAARGKGSRMVNGGLEKCRADRAHDESAKRECSLAAVSGSSSPVGPANSSSPSNLPPSASLRAQANGTRGTANVSASTMSARTSSLAAAGPKYVQGSAVVVGSTVSTTSRPATVAPAPVTPLVANSASAAPSAPPRHRPAGHGVDPMSAVGGKALDGDEAPTRAQEDSLPRHRIKGRVTAELKGSLFMESSPGVRDVFIPLCLCKTMANPPQIGDVLVVEAIQKLMKGNCWKVVSIVKNESSDDAGLKSADNLGGAARDQPASKGGAVGLSGRLDKTAEPSPRQADVGDQSTGNFGVALKMFKSQQRGRSEAERSPLEPLLAEAWLSTGRRPLGFGSAEPSSVNGGEEGGGRRVVRVSNTSAAKGTPRGST